MAGRRAWRAVPWSCPGLLAELLLELGHRLAQHGTGSQTVTPTVSGRPTTVSNNTGTVNLSSSGPTYIDGEGRTDFYALHTLSVPAGAGTLNLVTASGDQLVNIPYSYKAD
jgi:hypothetical protein